VSATAACLRASLSPWGAALAAEGGLAAGRTWCVSALPRPRLAAGQNPASAASASRSRALSVSLLRAARGRALSGCHAIHRITGKLPLAPEKRALG